MSTDCGAGILDLYMPPAKVIGHGVGHLQRPDIVHDAHGGIVAPDQMEPGERPLLILVHEALMERSWQRFSADDHHLVDVRRLRQLLVRLVGLDQLADPQRLAVVACFGLHYS